MSSEQGPRSAGMGTSANAGSHRHAALGEPMNDTEVAV